MICEHCEYSVHDVNEYSGNEFLYCKFYNDECIKLIPDRCEFLKKRSRCKYFNTEDGTCPKKCCRCFFLNPEKNCDEYARKDALVTKNMYQSFVKDCINKIYGRKEEETDNKDLSIWDMYPVQNLFYRYPFETKCLNKPYERKEEEMGEKGSNKVVIRYILRSTMIMFRLSR